MKNCLRDLAIKIHYQSYGIVPRHAKKNIYALFVIVIHKLTKTYRKDLTLRSSQCPIIFVHQYLFSSLCCALSLSRGGSRISQMREGVGRQPQRRCANIIYVFCCTIYVISLQYNMASFAKRGFFFLLFFNCFKTQRVWRDSLSTGRFQRIL